MKKLALATALASALAATTFAQEPAPRAEAVPAAGLSDLDKTTFACPKAALNAAAREVPTHPSHGTYQFSYFNIVSNSHHAAYEVHFTSNDTADPVLKFCVVLYCQQGFDPATTTSVTPIGTAAAAHAGAGAGHAADACSPPRTPARRRPAR